MKTNITELDSVVIENCTGLDQAALREELADALEDLLMILHGTWEPSYERYEREVNNDEPINTEQENHWVPVLDYTLSRIRYGVLNCDVSPVTLPGLVVSLGYTMTPEAFAKGLASFVGDFARGDDARNPILADLILGIMEHTGCADTVRLGHEQAKQLEAARSK